MPSYVIIKTATPGFHKWPNPDIPGAGYLAYRHRHLFLIKVCWMVTDEDRQVEFHDGLTWLTMTIGSFPKSTRGVEFGDRSCEMIAREICEQLPKGPPGVHWVEVWEDDECGARYEPPRSVVSG